MEPQFQNLPASTPSIPANLPSSSSTLRDRLRSRDASALPSSPKLPAYHDLYQQLRACLYTVSAPPVHNGKDHPSPDGPDPDADAATELRESFAVMGADLHTSVMHQLIQSHADIQQKISDFVGEASAVLSKNDVLYSNISYPLGATLCHSDDFPRASIRDHLANVKNDILSAKDDLQALATEWEACIHAQQKA
ncbi:hypothetical protein BGZ63DRAFT_79981 [Mariannaea sp. PMI_226]|nr:hypothetical protein BGZ63DRAFT_79981 [Mariannaea sp. PMI_226]